MIDEIKSRPVPTMRAYLPNQRSVDDIREAYHQSVKGPGDPFGLSRRKNNEPVAAAHIEFRRN